MFLLDQISKFKPKNQKTVATVVRRQAHLSVSQAGLPAPFGRAAALTTVTTFYFKSHNRCQNRNSKNKKQSKLQIKKSQIQNPKTSQTSPLLLLLLGDMLTFRQAEYPNLSAGLPL